MGCFSKPVGTRLTAAGLMFLMFHWPALWAVSERFLSPSEVLIHPSGRTLFVLECTAHQLAIYDLRRRALTKEIKLPERPSGMTLTRDGSLLLVATSSPEGHLRGIDLESGEVQYSIPVGHTPVSPLIAPDGKSGYVCNRFSNDLSIVDLRSRRETGRIPVRREPIAMTITRDGKYLFVANHLPSGRADVDYVSAVVSVIDTTSGKVCKEIALPNGSTGLRGICTSPDGRYVYLTHTLARFQVPTTQLDRGWMNTNALSIIDVEGLAWLNTVLIDEVDRGAANPWGIACSPDGKYICIALSGTHELAVLDASRLHLKLSLVEGNQKVSDVSLTPQDVPNDLSFLQNVRRRVSLQGKGPHGITISGSSVYVAEYFSDSVGVVDLDPALNLRAKSIPLGPVVPETAERRGEFLFNDASYCFQQWQSCSSCHPDVRTDGLNWDLLNDGIGNPKQVKSLLGTHETPPSMISGIRESASIAVRAGVRFTLFAQLPERDIEAIEAYLRSLEPIPSPYLINGELSDAARRGALIFERANCSECHVGPHYTNLNKYDLGVGKGLDQGVELDVPGLREVWRTAPYLHDGRAASIQDLLTVHNQQDQHGETSQLSEQEVEDLVAFILSL